MEKQSYVQHVSNGMWLSEILMLTLTVPFQLGKSYTVEG